MDQTTTRLNLCPGGRLAAVNVTTHRDPARAALGISTAWRTGECATCGRRFPLFEDGAISLHAAERRQEIGSGTVCLDGAFIRYRLLGRPGDWIGSDMIRAALGRMVQAGQTRQDDGLVVVEIVSIG